MNDKPNNESFRETLQSVRSTLTVSKVVHLTFDNHCEWMVEAMMRGLTIERVAASTELGLPFAVSVSYDANKRIVGACFSEGLSFGWLRISLGKEYNEVAEEAEAFRLVTWHGD